MDIEQLAEGPIPVGVRVDTGAHSQGTGTIQHARHRAPKAAAISLAGLTLMAISPGPHGIVTFPVGCILLYVAWSIWRVRTKLVDVSAACPGCQAQVTLEGGSIAEKMEDQCPECQRPLMLHPGQEA